MIDKNKVPPHNYEAETAVIGCMIRDRKSIDTAVNLISPDDFYNIGNGFVFDCISKLNAKNIRVDLFSLWEYIQKTGMIDQIEGYQVLLDYSDVGTTANIETYCQIVLANSQRRKLINAAYEIYQDCFNETDINALLDNSEKKILEVGANRFVKGIEHIKQAVIEFNDRFDDPEKSNRLHTKTNLKTLDNSFKASKSDLIIIAGRPAMGKSSLLLEIARNVCINEKLPVVLFTPEMSRHQVIERLITLETELSSYQLNSGYLNTKQMETYVDAIGLLSSDGVPFYIDDSSYLTIDEMRAKLRKFQQKHKVIGGIFTDYIQMLKSPPNKNTTRSNEVSEFALGCKNIAKEFNTTHWVGSQLNRDVESRQNKRPQLADLKESAGIEENANKVLLLYRDEYYNSDSNDKNIAEINLAKHREGPTGTIKMFFDSSITKFKDLEK